MRAIDILKRQYPMYTEIELMERHCPKKTIIKDMTLLDCLGFEYCNDCWEQEVSENESYNV